MKNIKINYKLLNVVLFFAICFLFYSTLGLWKFVFDKLIAILTPFIFAFVVAYALYPFLKKLRKMKLNKFISVFIIIAILLLFIGLVFYLVIPLLIKQLSALFGFALSFIQDISNKYKIDLNFLQDDITDLNSLFNNYGKPISDFSFSLISRSINFLSVSIISFITSIYFLADMDNIRIKIKKILKQNNKKTYNYFKRLDHEVSQYFVGLEKYIVIQFIEYTLIFFLIGHPYYLLLGILCSLTTIIPYFGGIFANIIACITAFFVSDKLFILTLIVAFICPNIDGYIISPRVYGETNNVPPVLTIFAVFAGGILYGVVGIIIALPIAIILLATFRYYEEEISEKIDDIRQKI